MPSAALPAFPSRYRDATGTCPCRHHRKSIKHCPALPAIPGHRPLPQIRVARLLLPCCRHRNLSPPKTGPRSPTCLVLHLDMKAPGREARPEPSLRPRKHRLRSKSSLCNDTPPLRPETSPRPSRDVPALTDKDGDPPYRPEQSFFGVGGGTGKEGAVFTKKRPFLPRQKLHPSLPKLPAAHAPARRPQWRAARRPCPPQPCGRRCGRQPGAPPG